MKLQISVDGQAYEVEVEARRGRLSPANAGQSPHADSATIQSTVLRTPPKPGSSLDPDDHEAKLCRSPLAGIVVQVPVALGQQLQVNDLMVVLEAMKMETTITSPVEGKLKSVNVTPGESVKANQVLVEFD